MLNKLVSAGKTQTPSLSTPSLLARALISLSENKKREKKVRNKKNRRTRERARERVKKTSTPLPLWETQLHADFRRLGRQCLSDTLKIADNEQPTSKSCINYRLIRFPVNPPGASSGRDCWETLSKSAPQTPQLCRFFLRFFLFFPHPSSSSQRGEVKRAAN